MIYINDMYVMNVHLFQDFVCVCVDQQCIPHKHPVCGSNGKTYRNHCDLHRDACLSGLKVQVAHDGHCEGKCVCAPFNRFVVFSLIPNI